MTLSSKTYITVVALLASAVAFLILREPIAMHFSNETSDVTIDIVSDGDAIPYSEPNPALLTPASTGETQLDVASQAIEEEILPEPTETSVEKEEGTLIVEGQPAPTIEELAERFHRKFDQEYNQHTMASTEVSVTDYVSSVMIPGATMRSVECRSSLCRMQMSFDSQDSDVEFFEKLIGNGDADNPDADVFNSLSGTVAVRDVAYDGSIEVVVYLESKQ